jgi:hypothetical protein
MPGAREEEIPVFEPVLSKDLTMNERSFIFPAYVTTPDRLFQWGSAFPDP